MNWKAALSYIHKVIKYGALYYNQSSYPAIYRIVGFYCFYYIDTIYFGKAFKQALIKYPLSIEVITAKALALPSIKGFAISSKL